MNISKLPFNAHTGIQPTDEEGFLLRLIFANHLLNHVGTIHASAIFALAEASSGEFLLRHAGTEPPIALVRKATAKYSAPADAALRSRTTNSADEVRKALESVAKRGRAGLTIGIEIMKEDDGERVAQFSFDWFLTRAK